MLHMCTPAVLRQAVYKRSQAECLHKDVTMELEVARQCCKASIPGTHVDGYIQQLGLYPFHVVFSMLTVLYSVVLLVTTAEMRQAFVLVNYH